ncbi:MAG: BON domain-containing protein [Chloracidobacterium sp.]|nr:BON domain-containing protein [Chloracidobacterium sp.]
MANQYDYDEYRRGRYERDYDSPYDQSGGDDYEEPYYRDHGANRRHRYGRGGYYNEPYRGGRPGGRYSEPFDAHDYGRYESGDRSTREPFYHRGYEGSEYREPYFGERYGRGVKERPFFERAGDEVRSWLGDEEADRRRRSDEMRKGPYAGRGPRGYQRSDERICEDINDRLTDDAHVDATDIEVTVNNCMVTLTGRVGSREEKHRAEDIAESMKGVKDVNNQLRVSRSVPNMTEPETAETLRVRRAGT